MCIAFYLARREGVSDHVVKAAIFSLHVQSEKGIFCELLYALIVMTSRSKVCPQFASSSLEKGEQTLRQDREHKVKHESS